jgi:hypothetical protein
LRLCDEVQESSFGGSRVSWSLIFAPESDHDFVSSVFGLPWRQGALCNHLGPVSEFVREQEFMAESKDANFLHSEGHHKPIVQHELDEARRRGDTL